MVTAARGRGGRAGSALDRLEVVFDDERAVANAGLLLPATVAGRLGLEELIDDTVDLGQRPGAARPGRKVMTFVHSAILGGDSIDDADVLRSGETGRVLSHRVMAPSTVGTFLRSFTFGHVRQLDRVLATALQRAWQAGAGPGAERLVVDLDSFVCEVHGYQKQGAAYGYTRRLGYHPLLASRADTGETLHVRLRKGSANTQRGAQRFVEELVARVRRAGASGPMLLRADSGFWSGKITAACRRLGVRYSIGVRLQAHVCAAIEAIPGPSWQRLADYPETGLAEIAETTLADDRLVVRRVRTLQAQGELFPSWRYHPIITNRDEQLALVEREHREHAVIELVIRDLKDGPLAHLPSGRFNANAAWLVISALAHNLLRWTALLGLQTRQPFAARTVRRRLLALPGRITSSGRRLRLHLPVRWPWQQEFALCLTRLRALPLRR